MPKLKTPIELTKEVFSPDVSTDDLIWTAITRDRQAIREALREGLFELFQDEHPMEDEVPVETYGYEETHNLAIKQALALVDDLLGGEVTK